MTDRNDLIARLTGRAVKATRELTRLWDQYEQSGAHGSVYKLAEAFDAVDRLRLALVGDRDTMGLIGRMIEEIGPLIPRDETGSHLFVEGVGQVVRHGKGKNVRWDQDRLIPRVAEVVSARVADLPGVVTDEDGIARPPSDIARQAASEAVVAMAELCGMTPSRDWRVTGLSALGISARDYRHSDFGGWTLRIERGVVDVSPQEHTEAAPLKLVPPREEQDG